MPYVQSLNGSNYTLPSRADTQDWAAQWQAFIAALCAQTLQPNTGSSLPLTAELDLGAAFGLRALALRSEAASPAAAGFLRLGAAELLAWRNQANNGDISLGIGSVNQLLFGIQAITSNPQAIYFTIAGQSFTTAVTTIVNFASLETDSRSSVTTGVSWKFTCSGANYIGLHKVRAAVTIASAIASGTTTLDLYVNGALARRLWKSGGAVLTNTMIAGETEIYLSGNSDTMDIRFTQSSGGSIALTTTAAENYVSITRFVT